MYTEKTLSTEMDSRVGLCSGNMITLLCSDMTKLSESITSRTFLTNSLWLSGMNRKNSMKSVQSVHVGNAENAAHTNERFQAQWND